MNSETTSARLHFIPNGPWFSHGILAVSLTLAVALILFMVLLTQRIEFYILFSLTVGSLLVYIRRLSTNIDFFEPIYLLFAIFLFAFPLRAAFAILTREDWIHDPGVKAALLMATLGFASMCFGYRARKSRSNHISLDPQKCKTITILFLLISLAAF